MLLLPSPPYVAVIVFVPPGTEDVVSVATPLFTVAVPSVVAPAVKVTVPLTLVGSVSVNVTEAPMVDGFNDEIRVEVGFALETT